VVWYPKDRHRVIGGRVRTRLHEIITSVIAEKGHG
jgi:hypothetical protein